MSLKIKVPNIIYLGSAVPSGGGGSAKQVTLLSITTAPSGTFEKGSKYYNSTTRLIYTATADDVWGTDGETPKFNTIYIYDNNETTEYYQWDGDNLVETDLEKYQLKSNITDSFDSSSQATYPSSKALKDGLETAKPNLFDIKTLSQAIAGEEEKGWACLSHTTRKDIAKASVPTLYDNILTKYNNVEKAELPWTNGASYTETDFYGGQRFLGCHNNIVYIADEHSICSSSNPISTSFTQIFWRRFLRYDSLFCGSKWLIIGGVTSRDSYEGGWVDKVVIMDYETNNTKEITFNGGYYCYFKEIGNYIYCVSGTNKLIARISNINFADITEDSLENVIDLSSDATHFSYPITDILYDSNRNLWYLTSYTDSNGLHVRFHTAIDLSDTNSYVYDIGQIDMTGAGRTQSAFYTKLFLNSNNTLIIVFPYWKGCRGYYTNDNFTTLNFIGELIPEADSNYPSQTIRYCTQYGDNVFISGCSVFRTYTNFYIPTLITFNIISLTSIYTRFGYTVETVSYGDVSNTVLDNNDRQYIFFNYGIHYSGLAPVKHIDSYQISSNPVTTVDITYYKFNDWKICTPDITVSNDTNLDRVYEYLGYHNYWRIDTTNETISLPRNSNLWTMMYVGDDYEDSNLPTGSFSNAPKKIIGTSAPTATTVGSVGDIFVDVTNVKIYICTNVYWDSTINNNEGAYVYVWTSQNPSINKINKTLAANTTTVNTEIDLSQATILNVYLNGIYQIETTNYSISTVNNETILTFTDSFSKAATVSIIYAQ